MLSYLVVKKIISRDLILQFSPQRLALKFTLKLCINCTFTSGIFMLANHIRQNILFPFVLISGNEDSSS